MKTISKNGGRWQVTGDTIKGATRDIESCHASRPTFYVSRLTPHASTLNPQPSTLNQLHAFTLIELLVVMGIIGALAAMLLTVVSGVKKKQYIYNTQAELAKIETALERYKAAYGVYPPSSSNPQAPLINQLFYELTGTTNVGTSAAPQYQSLDGSPPTLNGGFGGTVATAFGPAGFVNCSKSSGSEDSSFARDFLPDLSPRQVYRTFTNSTTGTQGIVLLIGSVRGPDPTYQPLGLPDLNPWRYNSSNPTNNPGSYDLWIQLVIGGKTNLICNWNRKVQINSPLP